MLTIAHLSDVHLPPVPGLRLGDITPKRLLGYANWHRRRKGMHRRPVLDALVEDMQRQRPDHIVVTGDLVNIGMPAEIAAAGLWLTTLGAPSRVTVIPGNHDVYGQQRAHPVFPEWRSYMSADAEGRTLAAPGAHGFPFVKVIGRVALIGTSTAVPTPPFLATGRLGSLQREALARVLATAGDRGLCRVLLIHHPPLPGQNDRTRRLEDAAELAELLARHGAELVLHGHNHVPMLERARGPAGRIPVVGVSSASADLARHAPPARYNLIRIDDRDPPWTMTLTGRELAGGGFAEIERLALV